MLSKPGTLWIVATPLGNSEDLSFRAKRLLTEADLVYSEDTRRAALLFKNCGLPPRKTISFFQQNESDREQEIIKALTSGKDVVLMSDAGTPVLADPGYKLVKTCRSLGLPVSPVPGPFAPAAALSSAGVAPLPFTFFGFLPRGKKSRQDLFASYKDAPGSLVFFERKDRLLESLQIAEDVLGPRDLVICREMTKTHEEFIVGRLNAAEALTANLLGELTIIIGPPETLRQTPVCELEKQIALLDSQGLKTKQIVNMLKQVTTGWSAKDLYNFVSSRE